MTTVWQSGRSSDVYRSGLGLVFTDARGRIVFADNSFLALIGLGEARKLVGEPLHKVIRVGTEAISAMMNEIASSGYVHERPLTITRDDGGQVDTICTGIATYDDQRVFIGADLTLRDPALAAPAPPATHTDVLGARIQQIEAEANTQAAEDDMLGQLYFAAAVSAVLVLLGRMAGPRVQQAVEEIVNQTAARGSWPVQLKGGHFVIGATTIPPEGYRAMLQEVIDYARNIVGQRLLSHEMQALDGQMKPAAQQIAQQSGMRQHLIGEE